MFLIKNRITPKPAVLVALLGVLLVAAPLLLRGTGFLINKVISYEYGGYQDFVSRGLDAGEVALRSGQYRPDLPAIVDKQSRLDRLEADGWLRIGHAPDSLPWAFRNEVGNTVGYDMEILHHLARDLGVGIEIVRLQAAEIGHALDSGQIDMYASGMMIDAGLLREFSVSRPYANVTLGLLVEDHRRQEFESTQKLKRSATLSLAVLQSPLLVRALGSSLPNMQFTLVDSPRNFLRGQLEGVDALVMSAEAASAWTLVYPQFSAVIPSPGRTTVPLVFGLPMADQDLERYVNNWIQAAQSLGVMDAAYEHWILGRDTSARQPRWSIIRDVLHWVD